MTVLSPLFVLSALFSFVVGIPATLLERGVNIPPVINNCSGTARPNLPNQIASAPGYAPQLQSPGSGWEEWLLVAESLVLNGTENPLFFARWSRGDPASPNSRLSTGKFAFWTTFDNGTVWEYTVNGPVVYNDVGGVKTWAVGDNKLIFDGTTGYWNHSMTYPGFSFQSHTEIVAPWTPFNPVMNGQAGLLRGELHSRIEMPRGHMNGNVTYPWGLNYTAFQAVTSVKHSWSKKPVQDSVDSYVRGTTYLGTTPSIQSVNWYQSVKDGQEIDASQYTKQTGTLDDLYILDQITNSPSDLSITTNSSFDSVLTFPGCSEQGGTPKLTWSTSHLRERYSFTDSAGAVTSFHSVSVTTNQWYNQTWFPVENGGLAFIEVYQSA